MRNLLQDGNSNINIEVDESSMVERSLNEVNYQSAPKNLLTGQILEKSIE